MGSRRARETLQGTHQGSPFWGEGQVGEAHVDSHKGFQKEINVVFALVSSDIHFVVLFALVIDIEFSNYTDIHKFFLIIKVVSAFADVLSM